MNILVFVFLLVLKYSNGACTDEAEKPTLYDSLCKQPAEIFYTIDLDWLRENNNKTSWYFELGNNFSRFHLAEIAMGEHLETDYTKEYETLCAKTKYAEFALWHVNGTVTGFGNLTAHWECKGVDEAVGTFNCEFSSDLHQYVEEVKFYPTYSDNKNYFVMVVCYAEGNVGWFTQSLNFPFSSEERTQIKNHVKSIGFDGELTQLYSPKCV